MDCILNSALQNRLSYLSNKALLRTRKIVDVTDDNCIVVDGKCCFDFSSNDYLGLKKHPKITEDFIRCAKKYGVGSGASALVSGYSDEHAETEKMFANWLGVDKTILFTSGYAANTGIVSALTSRSSVIFSDKLCHASLLDGIMLSKAKHRRYKHCDSQHLECLAKQNKPDFIVTESVFSMEGDLAPIGDLVDLAKKHNAGLLIDDAHGIGVLGKSGAGVADLYGISQASFSCLTLPLGKAFNAMGAIVAGRSEVIEMVLQFAKTYRYTTALPPAICHAVRSTLAIIQEENWRRERLRENSIFFASYAVEKELDLISIDETPIKAIVIQSHSKLLSIQKKLLEKGFFVSAIRPPTVPENKARLRISLNSLHTQDHIMQLIDNIVLGLKQC
jgi:8-amino-7-oxononanoate synthase